MQPAPVKEKRLQNLKGLAAIAGAAVIYSYSGVLIRLQARSFSSSGQVVARTAIALLIVLAVLAVKRNWRLPKSERWLLALFAVVATLYPLAMTVSTSHIKASNAIMMLYVGGILTSAIIGSTVFREKITPIKLASTLTALVGLVIFAYPFSFTGAALFGTALGLVAGLFDATCNSIRRYLRHTPREVLLVTSFATAVVLLGGTLAASPQTAITHAITLPVYVAVGVHGVGIVLVGYLLFYGFRHTDVHIGTIVLASEIFLSLVFNYVFLHESPSAPEFVGALTIFSASVLIALNDVHQNRKEPQLISNLE